MLFKRAMSPSLPSNTQPVCCPIKTLLIYRPDDIGAQRVWPNGFNCSTYNTTRHSSLKSLPLTHLPTALPPQPNNDIQHSYNNNNFYTTPNAFVHLSSGPVHNWWILSLLQTPKTDRFGWWCQTAKRTLLPIHTQAERQTATTTTSSCIQCATNQARTSNLLYKCRCITYHDSIQPYFGFNNGYENPNVNSLYIYSLFCILHYWLLVCIGGTVCLIWYMNVKGKWGRGASKCMIVLGRKMHFAGRMMFVD